jgi:glycosyltransferase involved in cell wall biosynthesis
MDVLFDARLLNRALSGLERVQLNVLRELSQMSEITRLRLIVLKGTEPAKPLPQNIEKVEVWTTDDIIKVIVDDKPDVYHMTWFPDTTPRDLWLPLLAPASVVEVHDAILNRHPEYFPSEDLWRWYDSFIKRLIRNADRLLVHTKSVAREIKDDLDGDSSIADIAPLAVDPDLQTPLSKEEVERRCRRIGFSGDFVLAVGKDYPHKDHESLFKAISRMDPNVTLCVAGSKIWRHGGQTSDEIIKRLGIESRVKWVQGLDDVDVKALIQGSRVMAFPSLEEGFGLPPIEAMTLGTPVVAADAMSIPEVCGDGAWLHPAGDDKKLEELLRRAIAGGEDTAALIERGHARAKEFSWRRTAELTVQCYRNAIATAKDRSSPRPEVSDPIVDMLSVISRYGQDDAEKQSSAWQQRCLGAESQLRRAHAHSAKLEEMLVELQQTPPEAPKEEPLAKVIVNGKRPRWSLRRRIRKIQDGLRERFKS